MAFEFIYPIVLDYHYSNLVSVDSTVYLSKRNGSLL